MLNELKEAAEVYEHSASLTFLNSQVIYPFSVRLADPTHNDAKMKLAEIYELLNEPRKALELVYEGEGFLSLLFLHLMRITVIDSRKKRPKESANEAETGDSSNPSGTSLFLEEKINAKSKAAMRAQNRLTHAQLRELEAQKEKEVMRGYRKVKDLWAEMLTGDADVKREWLLEAEKLVETFRETRNLFLTSRVSFFDNLVAEKGSMHIQSHPFRGMFPRSHSSKQQVDHEADQDRMVSRLHLDLGEYLVLIIAFFQFTSRRT